MKQLLLCAALAAVGMTAQAQSVSMNLDPSHTQIYFEVGHLGTSSSHGRWNKKEGKITWDRAAKTGSVEITVDATSIDTGVAPLDTHLKSKDFFNAAEFPTIKFVGDKFTYDGAKVASVSGTLTLLGQTRPVTLKANLFGCREHPASKKEVCGGDFETTLLRSDYGMKYGLPGIGDQVKLKIQVEAVRAD